MNKYTGFEYLLIDCANHYGLDKLLFEDRIQWGREHLGQLESLTGKAENAYLFMKTVAAIRKAQLRVSTGHLVALDACCSGMQIMSAVTGCISGARATGLVDPNRRADAYTEQTQRMQVILGDHFSVSRGDAKNALMTLD